MVNKSNLYSPKVKLSNDCNETLLSLTLGEYRLLDFCDDIITPNDKRLPFNCADLNELS